MDNTLTLDYPKRMLITNAKKAQDAILHMCDDCVHRTDCSGSRASRCNAVKEQIKDFAAAHFQEAVPATAITKDEHNKPILYDRIVVSSQPSNKPNSCHGCEPIYILAAVDIQELTKEHLEQEFEVARILHPIWKDRTLSQFINWKAEMHQSKFIIDVYETAYFLNPLTAHEYAKQNMSDINEAGCYPYIAIFSRPTNHMYAEANHCEVMLFEYDKETDTYHEIENIDSNIKYQYIAAQFDMFRKLPSEVK